MKKVACISVLFKGRRITIKPNLTGKFRIPGLRSSAAFSPKDLIEHPAIRDLDPWITTPDGHKMRVYQGGDPRQMVIETISFIESCEKENKQARKRALKARSDIYSLGTNGYPWEDSLEWD